MYRLTSILEFESEAHAISAYEQLRARATNTRIVGMGTVRQHSSYARIQDTTGATHSMFYIDQFGITRDGVYVPREIPEWKQPQGAHDSYPVTDAGGNPTRVEYNDRIWENTSGAVNQFQPGVSGWTDVGPGPGYVEPDPADPTAYPAWTPWTSGLNEDLYQIGDRVTHNEQNWEATIGNNHWEPGVSGWAVI